LGHGSATAVAGAATLNQGSGVITSEGLTSQQEYTLTLTNSVVAATSTVVVTPSNSAGSLTWIKSITAGSGSVVIVAGTQTLTGTMKFNFGVFN